MIRNESKNKQGQTEKFEMKMDVFTEFAIKVVISK